MHSAFGSGYSAFGTRHSAVVLVLTALFLGAHLALLPSSLEDLDSINFALGLRDFDVARHQPHPPGYPVYIAVGRLVHTVVRDEGKALGVVSAIGGAIGLLALIALFARIDPRLGRKWHLAAAVIAVTSPLYWVTAARPLSDAAGLAAALAVQALSLAAASDGAVAAAAFLSALAIGIRSQVAWLTVPLLILVAARHRADARGRFFSFVVAAFAAGIAIWAVPLVMLTGGPTAYWHALFDQGAEDLSGIQMLWTTPTPRQGVRALYYAFVAPWAVWPLAAAILLVAAAGAVRAWRAAPGVVRILAVLFGPYLVFDLLFQETFTSRYALPLVVPISFLAVEGLSAIPGTVGMTLAFGAVGTGAVIAITTAAGYASMPAPAFRLLEDIGAAARVHRSAQGAPVIAMHRREDLDLRRPILWAGAGLPALSTRLPAAPKHEWLELVKYWNDGGHAPVWFVADPQRTDVALVDHASGRRVSYRWPIEHLILLGGVRPNEMDWHIFDSPGWYLGEGWALTPETAGVAKEDHRGPGIAPIEGWIRRRDEPITLMIGGRNLAGAAARLRVSIDDGVVQDIATPPGFFLRFVRLPAGAVAGRGAFARLSVMSDVPELAIEQFDAQPAGRVVFGFGEGWHEMEYNPSTARSWRWASEHAILRTLATGRAMMVSIDGETEGLSRPTRVTIRIGDRALLEDSVDGRFSLHATIPAGLANGEETPIVVDSDQFFVPAEHSRRTQDRRRLALRVHDVQIRPAF